MNTVVGSVPDEVRKGLAERIANAAGEALYEPPAAGRISFGGKLRS